MKWATTPCKTCKWGKKVAKLVNLQAGEIKKIDKPFPCTVAWNYKGENESVMNM